ncbi:hypothetical protein ISG33_14250 [Glaciecola sp. MH2013]|uniref:hypothetical protein n=1 Tax=Glaciecola sp. MH2013 TaxID=2785524 RepID=UPI0018A0F746|nr:hypothetical protein [Glaciecola sp. MH2013]MBF7074563.1 hypothetical protein [Glaciecola sp. MH2013]
MDLALNVILIMLFGIGAAMFYVGSLIAVVTAFGKKQYAFGAITLLLPPFAVIYCLVYKQSANYPARFLLGGTLMMALAYILAISFHRL